MFQSFNYLLFFLIVLLSLFLKIKFIALYNHVLDIKFANIILDLLIIINSYNEDVSLLW